MGFFKTIVDTIFGKSEKNSGKVAIKIKETNAKGDAIKSKARHSRAEHDTDRNRSGKIAAGESRETPKRSRSTDSNTGAKEVASRERTESAPRAPKAPRGRGERAATKKPATAIKAPIKPLFDKEMPLLEEFVSPEWDATAHFPATEDSGKTSFLSFPLQSPILHAIYDVGFTSCTDIQAEILPHSLAGGDVTGRAQTGTGKTAAFLLTILYRLMSEKPKYPRKTGAPRALIMVPTRELALQIESDAKELAAHLPVRILSVFGGMDYDKQLAWLDNYLDIIIATPGRILDYYEQRAVDLRHVEILVLDEADRMLDMGFLPDMRKIINATPDKEDRQTMLFSATLTEAILTLASVWMNNPVQVEIEPEQITSANIEQRAYIVSKEDKFTLMYNLLMEHKGERMIIFANRRDQVRTVTDMLSACGFSCGMLTGDVRQLKRIKTLEELRNGQIDILVATDVAGRGIHVDDVSVVFNYTLPDFPDDYVHRIGRTGRAGAKGLSIAFATETDAYTIPAIEAHINESLSYIVPEDELLTPLPDDVQAKVSAKRRKTGFSRPDTGGRGRSHNKGGARSSAPRGRR